MAWMLAGPQLHGTFALLGAAYGDGYRVGEECGPALADILARLSLDDRVHRPYRRAVALGQHVQRDLAPLLAHVRDPPLLDALVRVLAELTEPLECLLAAGGPADVARDLGRLLFDSKLAFSDPRLTRAVLDHMRQDARRLDLDDVYLKPPAGPKDRDRRDAINQCLLLIRNVLHVPELVVLGGESFTKHTTTTASTEDTTSGRERNTSLQNRIVWNLFAQSADRALLQLMASVHRGHWAVALVQLVALLYKDQHVAVLQRLLAAPGLLAAGLCTLASDSSDDNESNTSPSDRKASGDSSPLLTSDPTSDSSDTCALAAVPVTAAAAATVVTTLTTTTAAQSRHAKKSSTNMMVDEPPFMSPSSSCSSVGSGTPFTLLPPPKPPPPGHKTMTPPSELSDYGYGTQVENQESVSTSSNEDETAGGVRHPPASHRHHPQQIVRHLHHHVRARHAAVAARRGRNARPPRLPHCAPTDEDVSLALRDFTVNFLARGYGNLVHELLGRLLTADDGRPHMDTSHFLWLVTYFLRFATQLRATAEMLAPVLSYEAVAYLTHEATVLCEPVEGEDFAIGEGPRARRAHLAVTALREVLQSLRARRGVAADALRARLAASQDLRLLPLLLLRREESAGTQYLRDVVLANHALLTLMDAAGVSMEEHLRQLGSRSVVRRYGQLLLLHETNGRDVNDCVMTFLHHVAGDVGRVRSLFQPCVLRALSSIWDSGRELCDDWRDLIEYVVHSFIEEARTTADASGNVPVPRAEDGADSSCEEDEDEQMEQDKKDVPRVPVEGDDWTEEDDDALYWHYVQSRATDDVIGEVVRLYGESGAGEKSRAAVAIRLKRQGLPTPQEPDAVSEKEQDKDNEDLRPLVERASRCDGGRAVRWLQSALLDACRCRLAMSSASWCGGEESTDAFSERLGPVAYCCARQQRSVPLVPWTGWQERALRRKAFVSLLQALGIGAPPPGGRWVRMPPEWPPARLLCAARLLAPVHDMELCALVDPCHACSDNHTDEAHLEQEQTPEVPRLPKCPVSLPFNRWPETTDVLSISIPEDFNICKILPSPPNIIITPNVPRVSLNSCISCGKQSEDLARMCVSDQEEPDEFCE